MQIDSSQQRKDYSQNKEFYTNSSMLKPNALTELCHDISNTEELYINVDKV
jgi:hypothetical protein